MEEQLQAFIQQYLGVAGVGNTEANKGQCVGLVSVWMDTLGIPHEWGNAIDLLNNADPQYFDVIYNKLGDTSQFPPDGAIVVLGKPYGLVNGVYCGHTGVSTGSDGVTLRLFEQNDPEGATPRVKIYSYDACVGWMIPKVQIPHTTDCLVPNTPEWQQKYQELVTGSSNWDEVIKMGYYSLAQLKKDLDSISPLQLQLSQASDKITELNREVNDYKTRYEAEQRHTIELNSQIADLSSALSKVKEESKDYGTQILDAQHQKDTVVTNLQALYKSLNATTQEEALNSIQTLRQPHDICVDQFMTLYNIIFNEKNGYIQKIINFLRR